MTRHQDNWYPGDWSASTDISGTGDIGYVKACDRRVLSIIRELLWS